MSGKQKLPFLVFVISAGLAYPGIVSANSDEAIIACSKESNALKRLVCFDAIAEKVNARDDAAKKSNETQLSASEQIATSVSSTAIDPKVGAESNLRSELKPTAQKSQTQSLVSLKVKPESENTDITESDDKMQTEVDAFGIPPKPKNDTVLIDGQLRSSIVGIRQHINRRLRFTLSNGQVWEKVDSSKVELPEVNDEVVLRSAALGAFYLRKVDRKRSFKVKRIVD